MADEDVTLDQSAPVDPASAPASNPTDPAPVDPASDGQDGGQQPQDDGLEDLDFGYEKYRVDPKLKKSVEDWRADHTRKTEALSHRTREVDSLHEQAKTMLQASEGELTQRAQLHHIESELKKLSNLSWDDWNRWEAEDPAAADQARRYRDHFTGEAAKLRDGLKQASDKRIADAQQDFIKRAGETEEYAKKNIKGWTPETNKQVVEFARASGIPDAFIEQNMSPVFYETLYYARIGKAAASRTQTAPGQAQPAPSLQTVGGRNPSAAFNPATADMDEYVARRREQMKARR